MRRLIWRLRYAVHAWRHKIDWRTAWYLSGVSSWDDTLDHFTHRDPVEEANHEIAYADYVTGR